MAYQWAPRLPYRYDLKRKMRGFEVAALQLNLVGEIVVDGVFGKKTEEAVKIWQAGNGLISDGIAGVNTQRSLCVEKSTPAARLHNLPVGLLKSYISSESGFYLGAVARHPSDVGYDIGPYQMSTGPHEIATQEFYQNAFDIAYTAHRVAEDARLFHDKIYTVVPSQYLTDEAGGDTAVFKWQMTALSHNWPAAAYYIPRYGHIFTDPARDDQPADWVISASGGRLETPREWVGFQVERKTVYVRW